MDADKDGISLCVCNGDTFTERDKLVATSGHDGAQPSRSQIRANPKGYIESHCLFRGLLPWDPPAVMATVTGIDDRGAIPESPRNAEAKKKREKNSAPDTPQERFHGNLPHLTMS